MRKPWLTLILLTLAVTGGCSQTPNVKQIEADLIGHTLMVPESRGWKFESLSEFRKTVINRNNRQGQIIEYDLSMRLRDREGKEYRAEVLVVYRQENGDWKVVSVSGSSITSERDLAIAVMTSDLKNFVTAQESYYADHNTYGTAANVIAAGLLKATTDVALVSTDGAATGFSATTTHPAAVGKTCGVWIGTARRPNRSLRRMGEVRCW